jgi:hypothetical protein
MKKRAPTLPPTIIDRPLSMIAMRVTFSRACARARKKKVILYARANARKCARESEEEMKKKMRLDTDTKFMKETKKRNNHVAIIARNIITSHKI